MTANMESMYWRTNKDWYTVDDNGNYHLTEKAPDRAKESFKLYNTPRSERSGAY